jgi:hypothetical protein
MHTCKYFPSGPRVLAIQEEQRYWTSFGVFFSGGRPPDPWVGFAEVWGKNQASANRMSFLETAGCLGIAQWTYRQGDELTELDMYKLFQAKKQKGVVLNMAVSTSTKFSKSASNSPWLGSQNKIMILTVLFNSY